MSIFFIKQGKEYKLGKTRMSENTGHNGKLNTIIRIGMLAKEDQSKCFIKQEWIEGTYKVCVCVIGCTCIQKEIQDLGVWEKVGHLVLFLQEGSWEVESECVDAGVCVLEVGVDMTERCSYSTIL